MVVAWSTPGWSAEPQAAPADLALETLRQDAELNEVYFLDRQRGWAVGGRGAIWRTIDGGAVWRLAQTPVDCRLESVHFLDADHGWAVGGQFSPYTHVSRGVILRTRDGGRTWFEHREHSLPALRRLRFFDSSHGWAIGAPSQRAPSGIFSTSDGGRSWSALDGPAANGWTAADFYDLRSGAVAGPKGALAAVRRGNLEASQTPSLGLRGLHALALDGPSQGWLVGDGGLALLTADGGQSWQTPPTPPPGVFGQQFDWQAVAVRGKRLWIAGTPGSRVLHSADSGHAWQAFATPLTTPIKSLHFVDDERGWAVGALGAILATVDGGRTWTQQRAGGERLAMLAVAGDPGSLPLELFAQLAGDEGFLAGALCITRRDAEGKLAEHATVPDRLDAAVALLGGCWSEQAWRFPARQHGLGLADQQTVAGWDRANDGRGMAEIEAQLVRAVRVWRPEVIVVTGLGAATDDPLGSVVAQALLGAVDMAADPTRYPEHAAEMGLAPWRVHKVFGAQADGKNGTVAVTSSQLAPRLGRSLSECAASADALLSQNRSSRPAVWSLQLYKDDVPQGLGNKSVMSGLALHPGGPTRRLLPSLDEQRIAELERSAKRHRNVQAILAQSESGRMDPARLMAQVGDLSAGLEPQASGEMLFELGQTHYRTGRWNLAAETFALLLDNQPDHELARPAAMWLVEHWASGEAAWRAQRSAGIELKPARGAGLAAIGSARTLGQILPADARVDGIAMSTDQPATLAEIDWPTKAVEYGRRLAEIDPALHADPRVQFALASAERLRGFPIAADRFFLAASQGKADDPWRTCALAERWLVEPQGEPPKRIWTAIYADAKPRLDGLLDEPFWRRVRAVEMRSALRDDASWGGYASLAYDREFLYLGVQCRGVDQQQRPLPNEPRARDANLENEDRVELYLDVDRDWTTHYRFVVDRRGWTAEDCWSDTTWNPQWFVAASSAGGTWSAEAAIPWGELTPAPPTHETVWAAGAQRIVPGVGFQSWTEPAAVAAVPEGFGLLIFQ